MPTVADQAKVEALMRSITEIGLQEPVRVLTAAAAVGNSTST